jgi:hypothetical protein
MTDMCRQNGKHLKAIAKMYFENAIEAMVKLYFQRIFSARNNKNI